MRKELFQTTNLVGGFKQIWLVVLNKVVRWFLINLVIVLTNLVVFLTNVQGLTEEFGKLEELDLKDSSLTHVKLFPKLPSLKKLDISENRLSKGLEVG